MKFLVLLSDEPMARAFGWSLLHFVWQGAIVGGLLALVLKMLSGRSARLRYGIACGALVWMVAMPLITFGYLMATMHVRGTAFADASSLRMPVMALNGGVRGANASWVGRIAATLDRGLPWILATWLVGAILFLLRLNIGLMVTRRLQSLGTQAVSTELQQAFGRLKTQLAIARTVRLVQSALVQVPTVIGWLRPVVLIPVGCLTGLSAIQIEAIFAHELAHIRRHDYLVSVLQSLVEAVLFYHPAVWWVSTQVRKERENCCDDLAVRVSGDLLAYAKALSFLEEQRSSYPAVSLGANGGALVMRIKRLLGYKEAPAFPHWASMTLLAVMVTASALGFGMLARGQASADKEAAAEQTAAEEQSVPQLYRKWLDEDVVYIITPEERAKYLKLQDNDERNAFIKQFWERRNVQGAANGGNAYRAEYYRRIAYTNQHFAATVPGWKSDRGRTYIVYGPPDSVDSHPGGGEGMNQPYEVWHYNLIREYTPSAQETQGDSAMTNARKDVDMKFIDTCACGNYLLQTSAH